MYHNEMALEICSIASGSNGNCYYIGNRTEAVLIDAGISCRETERRMARQGLSMQRVKAIFISHEHSDHIKGLAVLANKYQLPVYLTEGTKKALRLAIPERLLHSISDLQDILIGSITVTGFHKFHDAAEPYSFIVNYEKIAVGVFTDIGRVCERVTHFFQQCNAVFLESNYDEDMLQQGRYPYFLKNRIRNGNGHLSNKQALELFCKYRSEKLSHLLLSHLSRDNNNPDLVQQLFKSHRNNTQVIIAGRDAESPTFVIQNKQETCSTTDTINSFFQYT